MGRRKRQQRKADKRAKFKAKDSERHPWKTTSAERKKKRIEQYATYSA
ncbi:MAG: hypothetical protein ACETV0_00190 [Nitrososphaeria archaeon]